MGTVKPWSRSEPTRSPFALPSGLGGWFAGRIMLWLNEQQDVVDLLDVRPGEVVLEVGYGPGGLIRRLRRTSAKRICGVDPSQQMCDLVRRRADERIEVRTGTAERTGFRDAEFDCAVSVNNVAIWPNLERGLDELRRVTRPGGRLLIAWHGGTHPNRIARSQALREDQLTRIEQELGKRFTTTARHELTSLTAWLAR
ncbi:methyltransferase domain-containing protein [Saccharopolyspora sp. NPDC002686]|uniref:class I SAM-dependent methyltransferase n=1 Tax=Saccharopolyspora sp. NPDC002686 TaxID=3154541 RepID=UPI00331ED03A